MNSDTFIYLLVGLAKYYESDIETNHCPKELQLALNRLSLVKEFEYPKTYHGFLQKCQQPLHKWWPMPLKGIDMNIPLIEDAALSTAAEKYLQDFDQSSDPLSHSISELKSQMENQQFHHIHQQLKTASLEHPNQAQTEYVLLRRFLIENPFTNLPQLASTFRNTRFIDKEEVRALYLSVTEQPSLKQSPKDEYYFFCSRCGPLYARYGTLQPIKPSICSNECPKNLDKLQQIKSENQLVLRRTHQKRILIPGIPELALFTDLVNLQKIYPTLLQVPQLWPSLDTYDIELRFANETWVVDIKDHNDPYRLGKNLKEMQRSSTQWDQAFYVYPDAREEQLDYRESLTYSSRKLHETKVVSHGRFLNKVHRHLKSLAGDNQ